MDLTREALQHIGNQAIDASDAEIFPYAGVDLVKVGGKLTYPPAPPLPAPVGVVTLAGLIDYARHLADDDGAEISAALVRDPWTVELIGSTRATWEDRPVYARAIFPERARSLPIGDYHDQAGLIIALQTHFEDTGDRAALLSLLRVITSKQEVEQVDDGLSQAVTVRKGVTLIGRETVPNPVTLRPRRTFAEVEPVEERFVVRVRDGRGGVEIGLFQVGESWLPDWVAAVGAEVAKRLKAAELGDLPVIA